MENLASSLHTDYSELHGVYPLDIGFHVWFKETMYDNILTKKPHIQ